MFRIRKQFHFSAAHALRHLPADHPCYTVHGHNYIVEVVLEVEELDDQHFVQDYRNLRPIQDFIDGHFDHKNLSDELGFAATAENIARFLYDNFKTRYPALALVRVSETPRTWAEYFEAGTQGASL